MTEVGQPTLGAGVRSTPRGTLLGALRARLGEPNPVLWRELKQSVRLQRTPIVLSVTTGMMTLLICSVGGLFSVAAEPAKVGTALYHVFFSLAYAVVTWIGPAVAASSIASERSGRTWEAVLLTGLPAAKIARGKFLASLIYVGSYMVMLAPVGAVPFLFGGVTATEVMAAFVLLLLLAVLSVSFGLAISSKFSSGGVAIIMTLLVALPASIVLYVLLGPILSLAVHELWPAIGGGAPVWLPTAYARAPFGFEYLVFLIIAPATALSIPSWLFYEITIANLASPSDDRSSGVRRWFTVAASALLVLLVAVQRVFQELEWSLATIATFWVFLLFTAFLFGSEPLGPSRRTRVLWQRIKPSVLRRYLGPGILEATSLLLGVGLAGLGVLVLSAVLFVTSTTKTVVEMKQIAVAGAYAASFFIFITGLVAWARSRWHAPTTVRGLTLAVCFFVMVGPWIAMAIAGVLSNTRSGAMIIASPSPLYALPLIDALDSTDAIAKHRLTAGLACVTGWILLGVGLFGTAAARVRRQVAEQAAAEAQLDAMLAAENAGVATLGEPPQ
jgi:hypothetical protein